MAFWPPVEMPKSWLLLTPGRFAHKCRQGLLFGSRSTTRNAVLDRSSLFVIVPGLDDHKRWRIISGKDFTPKIERVCKGLAAPCGNMAIEPPRGFTVIKSRPRPTDYDLVGILCKHRLI